MLAAVVALLVWTGPHTPCVLAQPYDGDPASLESGDAKLKVMFSVGEGLLEVGPDRQSATVCAPPRGERIA